MRLITALVLCFTAATAAPSSNIAPRILGGRNIPNIQQWPQLANVLFTWDSTTFSQYCSGTVLTQQTVLTAAHCISFHPANRFRIRVASVLASSGGTSINVAELIPHPFYNSHTEDNDFGLIRSATLINFTNQIQPASIADTNYRLDDNEIVSALGWGAARFGGPRSEQLREVQLFVINQDIGSSLAKNL
ncbi:unnamed protein product [Arctia plantaginis]|uniref:Peptidase S1 domain-containing protein n=1 Tax=Arctia plantaginis TaxID=874455 RepID=A0A8S1A4X8_ARCPL|nr:unnamed protein product [Arctia plantaginis]